MAEVDVLVRLDALGDDVILVRIYMHGRCTTWNQAGQCVRPDKHEGAHITPSGYFYNGYG
jgi:hypothetical protein